MKNLSSYITISGRGQTLKFNYVCEIDIYENIQELTDTCSISFPRKLHWEGKNITELIRRGDAVSVKLGYDGVLKSVFEGYVRELYAKTPVQIDCEDKMFLLKKENAGTHDYSKTGVTLKKLLTDILPVNISFKVEDINLGKMRITQPTVAKVLDTLKTDYGIYSFFRNGKLYSQFVVADNYSEFQNIYKFKFGANIIEYDTLRYKVKEDNKIKIIAKSINDNDVQIEIPVGDADGEIRTLHYQNLSESELKKYAEAELSRIKYDGYYGSFKTFGDPMVKKADICIIAGDSDKSRENWSYLVKSVRKTFGSTGYKQVIELANKL